jgi:Zn2+/Cd2+-exporting ATPase
LYRAARNPHHFITGLRYELGMIPSTVIPLPTSINTEKTSGVQQGFLLTALTLAGLLIGLVGRWLQQPILEWSGYGLNFLAGGIPAGREAIHSLVKERKLDVDLLMVVAALGAASVGAAEDGAILLFLFTLSNTLQDWAMHRTSNAIQALMKLNPETATVRDANGFERQVRLEAITTGDTLVVKPGERFAADGAILTGSSSVDESAITGESVPVDKGIGDPVRSGTLNGSGALLVRVERSAGESTLAKLVRMVEQAQAAKSPTEQFADRLEGPYTIAVLLSIPIVYVFAHFVFHLEPTDAWYRAMTFLVAASPCAVVIATPAAMLSAMGAGARHGVLFKSGAALEELARARILAFDKTGTLTEGKMRLISVQALEGHQIGLQLEGEQNELLALAAGLERSSEHPVAQAIVAAFTGEVVPILDAQAIKGQGIVAQLARPEDQTRFAGSRVWAGNRALAQTQGIPIDQALETKLHALERDGYTTMILGCDARALAVLAVADTPRTSAKAAIASLHANKLRLVMLTGDRQIVAERVARELNVDEVRGELMPEQKLEVIAALKRENPVAMIGDGVNDAPALASADVGISMGSGSDVALESADVVLMKNDLARVAGAIRLARDAQATVRFNLSFALGVIGVVGTLSLFGFVPLPLAVIAHEGGTVFVCLVGLRLLAHPVTA